MGVLAGSARDRPVADLEVSALLADGGGDPFVLDRVHCGVDGLSSWT